MKEGKGPTLRKEVQILFLGWGPKIEGGSRNSNDTICNISLISTVEFTRYLDSRVCLHQMFWQKRILCTYFW